MKRLLIIISAFTLIASCKREDPLHLDDISGLGGDTWAQTELDKWLHDSITLPYNISVKYKWDQFELEIDKTVVPPKEEQIIPVMQSLKKVWIDPYIAEAGITFFNKYSPKFFVLAGSPSYNRDGTFTLGTADDGRKITLYQLNDFRNKSMAGYTSTDSAVLKQMFWVMEHEFAHVLDQNVRRPTAFDAVTAGFYTSDWINTNDAEARRDGIISAYGVSRNLEDFAEMISHMLVEGKSGFDAIVNSITGTSIRGTTPEVAKARLRTKEQLVINYFKDAWNIDFYSLQARKRQAIVNELY